MNKLARLAEILHTRSTLARTFIIFLLLISSTYTVAIVIFGWTWFGPDRMDVIRVLFVSFGGNLLFLLIVGLAPTLWALREPSKEPVERRVDYLITSSRVSPPARAYIREEVIRLCGYFESVYCSITILKYNTITRSAYLEFCTESTLRNTLASDTYSDSDYKLLVHPDDIPVDEDGIFGEIILAETIEPGGSPKSILSGPKRIMKPGEHFENFKMTIKPDSTTMVRMIFRIWCNADIPCYHKFYRYSEHASVSVQNLTNKSVRVMPASQAAPIPLRPNEKASIVDGPVLPGQAKLFSLA